MFVIKGITKEGIVYFCGIEKQTLWGSEWDVQKYSATIKNAIQYESYQDALDTIQEYELHNFDAYPVCPLCNKDYSEYPAISRKDNDTKICPNCGTLEALLEFAQDLSKKNKATN